jgi:uncharacterized membrane protein
MVLVIAGTRFIPALAQTLATPAPADDALCSPATPCTDQSSQAIRAAADAAASNNTGNVSNGQPVIDLAEAPNQSSGFILAGVIMVGMLVALGYAAVVFVRGVEEDPPATRRAWLTYATPALALVGLAVAAYLSYVETQSVQAICGPVGDCNAVQNSQYARLFGVLPVGVLGMIGYVAILVAWVYPRLRADRLARYAPLAVFVMALLGTLFCVYLTYLEIFVIRAVCIWCLTTAVIITALMVLNLRPALEGLQED